MSTSKNDGRLRWATGIYHVLLFLYPNTYRKAYGRQMQIVFQDIYREYEEESGCVGVRFWIRIVQDAVSTIVREYLALYVPKKYIEAAAFSLLTFFFTFLLISTAIWVQNNLTFGGGIGIKDRLTRYMQQHQDQITSGVFEDVFTQAQQCVGLSDKEAEQLCRKEAGRMLAVTLQEEELADENGQQWPHDLFFVKHANDKFYRLGWDGELKEISHEVNRAWVEKTQSVIPIMLRRHCTYFHSVPEVFACEVYESVPLANNSRGYMVRLLPFKSENNFFFILLLPLLALPELLHIGYMKDFGEEQLYYIVFSLLPVVISILVSATVFFLYKKKKQRR